MVEHGIDSSPDHRVLESVSSSGVEFNTVDQLRHNVQSQCFAFSVFIALNNMLHIFKWCEVLLIDDITNGAKTIARFMVSTYTAISLIFWSAGFVAYTSTGEKIIDEDGGSKICLQMWFAGVMVYFFSFMGWYDEPGRGAMSLKKKIRLYYLINTIPCRFVSGLRFWAVRSTTRRRPYRCASTTSFTASANSQC